MCITLIRKLENIRVEVNKTFVDQGHKTTDSSSIVREVFKKKKVPCRLMFQCGSMVIIGYVYQTIKNQDTNQGPLTALECAETDFVSRSVFVKMDLFWGQFELRKTARMIFLHKGLYYYISTRC